MICTNRIPRSFRRLVDHLLRRVHVPGPHRQQVVFIVEGKLLLLRRAARIPHGALVFSRPAPHVLLHGLLILRRVRRVPEPVHAGIGVRQQLLIDILNAFVVVHAGIRPNIPLHQRLQLVHVELFHHLVDRLHHVRPLFRNERVILLVIHKLLRLKKLRPDSRPDLVSRSIEESRRSAHSPARVLPDQRPLEVYDLHAQLVLDFPRCISHLLRIKLFRHDRDVSFILRAVEYLLRVRRIRQSLISLYPFLLPLPPKSFFIILLTISFCSSLSGAL